MKTNFRFPFAALVLLACAISGEGQTVSWTGAGNGSSWDVAANWSGGALPSPANDVLITGGLGTTVSILGNVTVKSLQCAKSLTVRGGSLTLTSGASVISGSLEVSGGASLTVNGALASLTANGAAIANDANLSALSGGVLHFPALTSATNMNNNVTWRADGAGSLLDLSRLRVLSQGFYQRLYVEAYNGGIVDLRRLGTVGNGAVQILANGASSTVDLSGLSSILGCGSGASSLTARNGGAILASDQGLLLANTDVNVPSGHPVLPDTLAATACPHFSRNLGMPTGWNSAIQLNPAAPGHSSCVCR